MRIQARSACRPEFDAVLKVVMLTGQMN